MKRDGLHPDSDRLFFYLNGTLGGEEQDSLRAHLAACSACDAELRELTEVTRAIEVHGIPADRERPASPARRYAVAAAVLLPLLLGALYWSYVRRTQTAPVSMAEPVELALGGGPTRAVSSRPTLALTDRPADVRLSFEVPFDADGTVSVELLDTEGLVLLPARPLAAGDRGAGRSLLVPHRLLARPGDYLLVARSEAAAGRRRTYRFPFSIVAADQRQSPTATNPPQ